MGGKTGSPNPRIIMAIAMRCPTCGKGYQLLDEQAGLRVRCKECKTAFDVPRQPERLEVVPQLPKSRGPRLAEDEEDLDDRPIRRKKDSNRTLIWVVSILGMCLVLCVLISGGVILWITFKGNPVAQMVAPRQEPPQSPPPTRPAEKEKTKDVVIDPPQFKLPSITVKDYDDAIQKLRTGNQFTRLRVLEWLKDKGPPADPAKKKAVFEAMDEAGKNDGIVMGAGQLLKIGWGEVPGLDP
jgi:hypothetical protein